MWHKSEVFTPFKNFVAFIETQFFLSIQQFQSDGGGEFNITLFRQFCAKKSIHYLFSCPHTHQYNGLAKRKHRHKYEMGRTLLLIANLPHYLWAETFCIAVYLINRFPTPILQ